MVKYIFNKPFAMENNIPQFGELKTVEIKNFLTRDKFSICRADGSSCASEDAAIQVAAVCSQPSVYDFLFREKFNGRPYDISDARNFLDGAKKGWEEKKHFVFLVKDQSDKIVGSLDVRSADLAGAEIGYWADENNQGFMTNAVKALCDIAKNAGYRSLRAIALMHNPRSAGVLKRAGFKFKGMTKKGEDEYLNYEIVLD
jgi:RimJ/RimL family protein N-acetyltransferase